MQVGFDGYRAGRSARVHPVCLRCSAACCARLRPNPPDPPLTPTGLLRLTFTDGDVYQWSKVSTTINNLILGRIYIDHGGIMKVRPIGAAAAVEGSE